jgi:hypothetical protein
MSWFRRSSGRKQSSPVGPADPTQPSGIGGSDRDAFDKASSRSEPIRFAEWIARMVAAVQHGDTETVRRGAAHYTTCPKCSTVVHAVDAWPDNMKRDSTGYLTVACPQCAAPWWKY